jgi:uroporphyrinogen decarboxylase
MTEIMSPRERVNTALGHVEPDRVPVDFLATPEVWHKLIEHLAPDTNAVGSSDFFDPAWEAILRHFEVDCRLLSYDQFCRPPDSILHSGAVVEWWDVLTRSTPNRMWRQRLPDGTLYDIWGRPIRIVEHATGAYEEAAGWTFQQATSVEELKNHPWPEPDWWDFSPLPEVISQLDEHQQYHFRFRIGSVFESAWQLRGMQEFLMDLALSPEIPIYIMDRLTEVHLENTRRVLDLMGDRLDMVYFYDDVATQNSLMISPKMWHKYMKPRHLQLIELAKSYDKPVMYHCDGAVYPLISELVELGIDLLNPIQTDAKGMEPQGLKDEFGDRLCFHGGVDIIKTLPRGTPEQVTAEVKERVRVLGENGGYVLGSSHHIQPDTRLENVLAMYNPDLRYRNGK